MSDLAGSGPIGVSAVNGANGNGAVEAGNTTAVTVTVITTDKCRP
jgi:hypothetical protein